MSNSNPFTITITQPGAVPAYLSGMSDWQVASLTPSQGQPQARYVYPSYWRDGTTGGVPLNFSNPAWPDYESRAPGQAFNTDFYLAGAQPSQSGAVFDPTTKRLYYHGGGHAAGPFNGIFYYDFSGDAAPVGWVYCAGSDSDTRYQADPANWEIAYNYSPGDGAYYVPWSGPRLNKPASVHTANQHVFVPSRNRYYRFGGATFGKGQVADTSAFYWDVSASQWYEIPAFQTFDTQFPADARLSPDESKVFVWSNFGDYFVTLADTPAGHTITPARSTLMPQSQPNPLCCLNEDTGEYLVLAYGNSSNETLANYIPVKAWTEVLNWGGNTVQSSTVATLDCPTTWQDPNSFSPMNAGMFYDKGNQCFWVVGDRPPGYPKTQPYILTAPHLWKIVRNSAASYSMTKVTLPTPITTSLTSPSAAGLHGRIAWFEEWRTLMVGSHNYLPMYALKIPTGI